MEHSLGKKIVVFFLVIGMFAPFGNTLLPVKRAYAQEGAGWPTFFLKAKSNIDDSTNTVDIIRDNARELLAYIAKGVAKSLLRKMTLSTIDWINSGFDGNPLFIENPTSFFSDFANQELDALVGIVAYDQYNYPFGRSFAQNLILSIQNKFERNAQFTLQSVLGQQHWSVFVNNSFRAGGWNGYLALSQPQNNPYGFALIAAEEYSRRTIGTQVSGAQQIRQDLEQAGGILTPKVCIPGQLGYEGSWTEEEFAQARAELDRVSRDGPRDVLPALRARIDAHTCSEDKKISTTPGVAITAQLEKALGTGWSQTELGTVLQSDLSAIFDALLSQLVNRGLTALSDRIEGSSGSGSSSDRNLNYYGLSVGTGEEDVNWRNTPDRIVDLETLLVTGELGPLLDPNDDPATGTRGPNGPTVIELTEDEVQALQRTLRFLDLMPERTYALDTCLPGADYGWEERFTKEVSSVEQRLNRKLAKVRNQKKIDRVEDAIRKLSRLKDERIYRIKSRFFEFNIPSAVVIDDAVKSTRELSLRAKEFQDAVFRKTATLSRLKALKANYELAGTEEEKKRLVAQYLDIEADVSTTNSLRQAEADLSAFAAEYARLEELAGTCASEKSAFGYDDSGSVSFEGTDTSDLPSPFTNIDLADASEELGDVDAPAVLEALDERGTVVDADQEASIAEFNTTELLVFYALVDQKSQSVAEALDEVLNNMPDNLFLPISFDGELVFYCQGVNETLWDSSESTSFVEVLAGGVFLQTIQFFGVGDIDAEINCRDFYHADIWEYRIDGDY